jgi:hypothetical protein
VEWGAEFGADGAAGRWQDADVGGAGAGGLDNQLTDDQDDFSTLLWFRAIGFGSNTWCFEKI